MDDPGELFLVIDHRQGPQIVLVEELGDLSPVCVDVAGDKVASGQIG